MINLTVQSQNNKMIDIISIDTNSLAASISNNQSVNLLYDNYILQIQTSTSSFAFSNFWNTLNSVTQDALFIAFVILILILVSFAVAFLKRY